MSLRDTPKHENGRREPERAELKTKPEWQFSEQGDERLTEYVILSPIRFAHSSTSLTVPERSRREGRLFACHSDPAVWGSRGCADCGRRIPPFGVSNPARDSSSSRCNESGLLRMTASGSRVTQNDNLRKPGDPCQARALTACYST